MKRNRSNTFGSLILVTNFVTGASQPAWAQDAKTRYPNMAPPEQYLMADRNAEIAGGGLRLPQYHAMPGS
ncbi:MAG TPA: hypothetical protein VN833_04125 [Candidatus Acidoferrales bacterium]|nr:hypothetical protein [Candidatus Acidoferrales bacterium]